MRTMTEQPARQRAASDEQTAYDELARAHRAMRRSRAVELALRMRGLLHRVQGCHPQSG